MASTGEAKMKLLYAVRELEIARDQNQSALDDYDNAIRYVKAVKVALENTIIQNIYIRDRLREARSAVMQATDSSSPPEVAEIPGMLIEWDSALAFHIQRAQAVNNDLDKLIKWLEEHKKEQGMGGSRLGMPYQLVIDRLDRYMVGL